MVRIRRMLDLIREGQRCGRLESSPSLARKVEAGLRTVYRDLDVLRDDWGAPIEYDSSRKGFFLAEEGWALPGLTLNSRELTALHAIKKYAGTFNGTPFEKEMQSLLGKLEEGLSAQGAQGVRLIRDHCSIWEDDYAIPDPDVWAVISGCIEQCKKMEARYRRFDGVEKRYVLHPYHLAWHHGQWYLLAYHEGRSGFASFAVSRFLTNRGTSKAFKWPTDFHPEQFHEGSFGVSAGKRFAVHLRFSPAVAAFISERQWHPTQKLKSLSDGGVELKLSTSAWKPLVRFILSWQPDVVVLKPKSLELRIRKIFDQLQPE